MKKVNIYYTIEQFIFYLAPKIVHIFKTSKIFLVFFNAQHSDRSIELGYESFFIKIIKFDLSQGANNLT